MKPRCLAGESDRHHLIFVYGTLKRGHRNHARLDGSAFVAKARTWAPFVLMAGRIPVMFAEPGRGGPVCGELYAVDAGMLAMLDWFEGHPGFYRRTPIEVYEEREEPGGARRIAETYLYRGPLTDDLVLLDGDYCEIEK